MDRYQLRALHGLEDTTFLQVTSLSQRISAENKLAEHLSYVSQCQQHPSNRSTNYGDVNRSCERVGEAEALSPALP